MPTPKMKNISTQIKDALSRYESMRDSVGGCGDHGCLIKKPSGMATNGGCRCLRDSLKTQRMMRAAQDLFSAISELCPEAGIDGVEACSLVPSLEVEAARHD